MGAIFILYELSNASCSTMLWIIACSIKVYKAVERLNVFAILYKSQGFSLIF